jgi:hypothetical protein
MLRATPTLILLAQLGETRLTMLKVQSLHPAEPDVYTYEIHITHLLTSKHSIRTHIYENERDAIRTFAAWLYKTIGLVPPIPEAPPDPIKFS